MEEDEDAKVGISRSLPTGRSTGGRAAKRNQTQQFQHRQIFHCEGSDVAGTSHVIPGSVEQMFGSRPINAPSDRLARLPGNPLQFFSITSTSSRSDLHVSSRAHRTDMMNDGEIARIQCTTVSRGGTCRSDCDAKEQSATARVNANDGMSAFAHSFLQIPAQSEDFPLDAIDMRAVEALRDESDLRHQRYLHRAACETPDAYDARCSRAAEYKREQRALMTDAERQMDYRSRAYYARQKRAAMSEDERGEWRRRQATYAREKRRGMSEEALAEHRARAAERARILRQRRSDVEMGSGKRPERQEAEKRRATIGASNSARTGSNEEKTEMLEDDDANDDHVDEVTNSAGRATGEERTSNYPRHSAEGIASSQY